MLKDQTNVRILVRPNWAYSRYGAWKFSFKLTHRKLTKDHFANGDIYVWGCTDRRHFSAYIHNRHFPKELAIFEFCQPKIGNVFFLTSVLSRKRTYLLSPVS